MQNIGRRKIVALTIEALLPESVVAGKVSNVPAGTSVLHGPIREEMVVIGTGNAQVISKGQKRPIPKLGVQVSDLLPGQKVEYRMRTEITRLDAQDLAEGAGQGPIQLDEYTIGLNHYIRGSFQYQDGDQYRQREFVVPLAYQADQRTINSLEVESNIGQFRFREMMRFW